MKDKLTTIFNNFGAKTQVVFPGIFDEGVLDGSQHPDRYFGAKKFFFTPNFQTQPLKSIPVFRPGRQNAEMPYHSEISELG